ncbi:MAG: hypothetical protein ACI9N1_002172, partial [Flavobacteriales bacterium]
LSAIMNTFPFKERKDITSSLPTQYPNPFLFIFFFKPERSG